MVNQRSQNHATKILVYLIQVGQNGVIGLNVVKLVVEAPNLDQEPVKCQNQSEKPEISILKKTSHVQVHLQWFYSANWKIAHQKHNGDLGVHGVNVQRIVEVVRENGKGNVTQLRDTVNPQLVLEKIQKRVFAMKNIASNGLNGVHGLAVQQLVEREASQDIENAKI